MIKIWAKTILDEKITRDIIYKDYDKFDPQKLHTYLIEICEQMDIPTPVVLLNHISNFDRFNITRFKISDFVETVDFDVLVLENVAH